MPSLTSQGLILALVAIIPGILAGSPVTCANPQLSCQNTTSVSDLCCFNSPGGSLLQTQFWDSSPSTGPTNSWTIHGLWPDNCDGTYEENCDPSRYQSDITSILTSFGKTDLLDYMNTYWKNQGASDSELWSHEWDTHGTCINTLDPSCYTGYESNEEVADFFQLVVDLFSTLDTYTTLANAGITPSSSKTYTTAEIQNAIKASFGYEVYLGCTSGALEQMYYYFEVSGNVLTGTFVPTSPSGSASTCPSSGIKYLPKSGSAAPNSPAPTSGWSTAAGSPSTSKTTVTTVTKPSASTTTFTSVTIPSTSATTVISVTSSASTPSSTAQPSTTFTPVTSTTSSISPSGTPGTLSGSGYFNGFTSGSETGCLISAGVWFVGGTCATYSANNFGSGFTLTSSKGSCGVEDSIFACGRNVSPSVFTTLDGYLAYNGNSQFYASDVPGNQVKETVSTSPDNVLVQFAWQAINNEGYW